MPTRIIKIDVVFGLQVSSNDATSLVMRSKPEETWSLTDFNLADPNVLRDMFLLCTSLPEHLHVRWRSCWVEHFHSFVEELGERFPPTAVRFHELMSLFLASVSSGVETDVKLAQQYSWMRRGNLSASFVSFRVDIPPTFDNAAAREYRKKWDAYLEEFRQKAYSQDVFHTSETWALAEAQGHLFSITIQTLILAIVSTFVILVVFLHSRSLSMFVLLAAISPFSCLVAIMVTSLHWTMEPIEAIIMIVLTSSAITSPLQVGFSYAALLAVNAEEGPPSDPEQKDGFRLQLVAHALSTAGPATLGSTFTTLAYSLFLCFCSLPLFFKLGESMVVLMPLLAFATLVPLPAVLLMAGPLEADGRCAKARVLLRRSRHRIQKFLSKPPRVKDEVRAKSLSPTATSFDNLGGEVLTTPPRSPAAAKGKVVESRKEARAAGNQQGVSPKSSCSRASTSLDQGFSHS